MDLSIVIVTYNSKSPIEQCLASIERHGSSLETETIVIDNASSDGTIDLVKQKFPWVRSLANESNLGYSRAVNQAIRLSSGRFILILNPDIVVSEGAIDALVSFMNDHPDAGIAGAKLVNPDGTLQYSARAFYTVGALVFRRTFLGKLFPNAKPLREHLLMEYDHAEAREVDWIIGACMMVRRDALEKVGGMDERFFLYFEDIDWCFRMKRHGWKVYYVPSAVMMHTYERSSARSVFKKPFFFHFLSMLRYYEKWNSAFYWFRRNRAIMKALVLALADLLSFNLAFLAAYYSRHMLQPLFVNELYPVNWYLFFMFFYNLVFLLTFVSFGLYKVKRETPLSEELVRIGRAVVLGVIILMAATYISRIRIYSRAVVVMQGLLAIVFCTFVRQLVRAVHREMVKARFDLKHVLIVGTKDEWKALSERFASEPELGIEVIGFLDMMERNSNGAKDLPEIVERFTIQELVLSPSQVGERTLPTLLAKMRRKTVDIKMISPLAGILGSRARVEEIAGLPAFSVESPSLMGIERFMKRCGDILGGLAFLIVSLFVFAFYAVLRCFWRGRCRYWREERIGSGGIPFIWPRATYFSGKECSDLLKPGLWLLVVRGKLSLVGPPALKESLSESMEILNQVRPGITGHWRISHYGGAREALFSEISRLESLSAGRDISMIVSSIGVICGGRYPEWFYGGGNLS